MDKHICPLRDNTKHVLDRLMQLDIHSNNVEEEATNVFKDMYESNYKDLPKEFTADFYVHIDQIKTIKSHISSIVEYFYQLDSKPNLDEKVYYRAWFYLFRIERMLCRILDHATDELFIKIHEIKDTNSNDKINILDLLIEVKNYKITLRHINNIIIDLNDEVHRIEYADCIKIALDYK